MAGEQTHSRWRRRVLLATASAMTLVVGYAVLVGALYLMGVGGVLVTLGLAVVAAGLLLPRDRLVAVVVGITGVITVFLALAWLWFLRIPADF
ncbi:MAG TPA: hypothetical protein VNU26_17820 [Mycobacteriales bacterium]|nr:hypothetical protein [Mycobacteriales bacterium]